MDLFIDKNKIAIFYRKKSEERITAYINGLQVASITFSETVKKWFVNFCNISTDVYEWDTKQECDACVKDEFIKFIENSLDN